MEFLVEESRRVDCYQEPLLHRHELSPDLARRMYWWVSAALREHFSRHFEIDPEALDDQLEDVVAILAERASRDPHQTPSAGARLAGRLADAMMVTPSLLARVPRQGADTLIAKPQVGRGKLS